MAFEVARGKSQGFDGQLKVDWVRGIAERARAFRSPTLHAAIEKIEEPSSGCIEADFSIQPAWISVRECWKRIEVRIFDDGEDADELSDLYPFWTN